MFSCQSSPGIIFIGVYIINYIAGKITHNIEVSLSLFTCNMVWVMALNDSPTHYRIKKLHVQFMALCFNFISSTRLGLFSPLRKLLFC